MKKNSNLNKKVLLVINPRAGVIKTMTKLSDILDVFGKHGYVTTSFSTKRKNDATEIIKKYAENHDLIVCCGGDGTLNEVITGVMSLEIPLPIGYIPTGTSNDFAANLELSMNVVKAAHDIIDGKLFQFDIGSFNDDSYFSGVAFFGTLSEVSYLTSQKMKNTMGYFAYVLKGASSLFKMRTFHTKIEYNGKTVEDDFILGGVSNSKAIAGILNMKDKDIVLNDGIFEIIFVRKPHNVGDLSHIARWLVSQNPDNPSVLFDHTSSAVITSKEFIPWTVDGEFAGFQKRVEILNNHNAISFLSPK